MSEEALKVLRDFQAQPIDREVDAMTQLAARLAARVAVLEAEAGVVRQCKTRERVDR